MRACARARISSVCRKSLARKLRSPFTVASAIGFNFPFRVAVKCSRVFQRFLFRVPPREVGAHDSSDCTIQVFDQFAAGCFIAFAHPAQTGRFIKSVA